MAMIVGFFKSKRPIRHKATTTITFIVIVLLMFVYITIQANSGGAFGNTELYGFGRVAGITEIAILLFALFFFSYRSKHNSLLTVIIIWILWTSVSCIHLLELGESAFINGLLVVIYCPCIFIFFYLFHKYRPDALNATIKVFILLTIYAILLFSFVFTYRNQYIGGRLASINDIYYVVMLFPWTLCLRKSVYRILFMTAIFMVVLWSMKRGPLVAILFSITGFFIAEGIRTRKKTRTIIIVAIIATIFSFLIINVYETTGGYYLSRFESIEEDHGSGRLEIYKDTLKLQADSTIFGWIFGHGHNAVSKYAANDVFNMTFNRGLSAHNDWQEVLFDYGIPGLILMVVLNILVIKQCFLLMRVQSRFGPPMIASYLLFLITSLVSHLILYPTYFSYTMAFWGTICSFQNGNPIGNKLIHQPALIISRRYRKKLLGIANAAPGNRR